jgi:hypothetical protein
MDGMEERILTAEEARDALKAECDRPENATDGPKLVELFGKLQERQVEVDRLYARWDELHRRASEAEGLPG